MYPILEVEQLHVRFPGAERAAVSQIKFSLHAGETIAIVGESGSGKSITSLAIMGLLPPNASTDSAIYFRPNSAVAEKQLLDIQHWENFRGREMAMVFQEPMSALNPVMNVGKQLKETLARKWPKKKVKELANLWFKKVQLPSPNTIGNKFPHQLSGGQKQRVMIAMAMCNEPALLIADEPTTALDASIQWEILQLMKQLQKEQGTALIFITHDLQVAAKMADQVIVMRQGEMVELGTTDAVLERPQHFYTQALLRARAGADWKGYRLPVVQDFLQQQKQLKKQPLPEIIIGDEDILTVEALTVRYPEKKNWKGAVTQWMHAVNEVSFNLKQQETLALVGESGSGKSTIGKALVGLVPAYAGKAYFQKNVLLDAKSKTFYHPAFQLQMIFQDAFAALNPRMTVKDMLQEPLVVHQKISREAVQKRVIELLDLTGMPKASLSKYPHEFSGGQRQRLGIARSLAMQPKVLICDESVSALDVSIQAQILNLLNDLKAELKLSYLFITHDLQVVQYFCDRVLVLYNGQIIEEGKGESWFQNPKETYTRKLLRTE